MPAPLSIRTDRDAGELRRLARRERDGRVSARLLALASALEGLPREEAARLAGMTGQTLGDWVHRYNAEGVEGLRDRPRPGRPCALDEGQQAALKALILKGPKLERDGGIAWRARDLCALVEERFGVRYGESGMLKLLKGLDLSWRKTRPIHPEADPRAQERFKNLARRDAGDGGPAPRGRAGRAVVHGRGQGRPEGPPHPRLVPEGRAAARGAAAGLRLRPPVRGGLPGARRGGRAGAARGLDRRHGRLPRRAEPRDPAGTHAGLVLDGAGWHVSEGLTVPANLTLIPLPPYSPELNPVERVWEYLRDRWLSHRVLAGGYAAVVDAACAAWNALLAEPGRLRSLTNFPWLPASVTTS